MHGLLSLVFSPEPINFCIFVKQLYQILFLKPNYNCLQANGKLNSQLVWNDDLDLSKTGYIQNICYFINIV